MIDKRNGNVKYLHGYILSLTALPLCNKRCHLSCFSWLTEGGRSVWLPSYVEAHFSARVLLFANAHGDYTSKFSDYKKFRVESVIVSLKNKK